MKVPRIGAAAAVVLAPLSRAYAVSAGAKTKIAKIPAVLLAGIASAPLAQASLTSRQPGRRCP